MRCMPGSALNIPLHWNMFKQKRLSALNFGVIHNTVVNRRSAKVCARARCFKCSLQMRHMNVDVDVDVIRYGHSYQQYLWVHISR